MRNVLSITVRFTLPLVGLLFAGAILLLPTGITAGPVGPWVGPLALATGMIGVGRIAWEF